jgi:hypothetical protein
LAAAFFATTLFAAFFAIGMVAGSLVACGAGSRTKRG